MGHKDCLAATRNAPRWTALAVRSSSIARRSGAPHTRRSEYQLSGDRGGLNRKRTLLARGAQA